MSSGIAPPRSSARGKPGPPGIAWRHSARPRAGTSREPAQRHKLCDNIRRVRRAAALALLICGGLAEASAEAVSPVRAQVEGHGRHSPTGTAPSSTASIDAAIDRAFTLIDDREPTRAENLLLPITCRSDLTDRQRARSERALGLAYVALNRRSHAAEAFGRAIDGASAAGDRNEAG